MNDPFIICTNDSLLLEECVHCLDLLDMPEEYETELLTIPDTESIASACNEKYNGIFAVSQSITGRAFTRNL